MERIICLLIGYVLGLFQTAYIYGKLHGIDIREYGSGNAGTTNALRVLGKKAGLIVLLGDICKCFLAVQSAKWLFGKSYPEIQPLLELYAGAGAVLGHNFPFYLKFKGGKGIAATAGLILALPWPFVAVAAPVFFITLFTTHYVSLGSLLVYAGFVIEMVILGQRGFFGMTQPFLLEMYILALLLAVMAYVKHWGNIKRLLRGEERKTYLIKKNRAE